MSQDPFAGFSKGRDYLGTFGLLENAEGVLLVANERRIAGKLTTVWDLPGGGVEPGETLEQALVREMREETSLRVRVGPMLFVAEGERVRGGERVGVWRSFFFRIESDDEQVDISAEPDLLDFRFEPRTGLPALLTAPYHRGFLEWLASDGAVRHTFDVWED